jgi:hypothetical protein
LAVDDVIGGSGDAFAFVSSGRALGSGGLSGDFSGSVIGVEIAGEPAVDVDGCFLSADGVDASCLMAGFTGSFGAAVAGRDSTDGALGGLDFDESSVATTTSRPPLPIST